MGIKKINLLYEEDRMYLIEEILKSKVVKIIGQDYWEDLLQMSAGQIFDELNFDGSPSWNKISGLSLHCRNADPVPDVKPIRLVNEKDLVELKKNCKLHNKSYSDFLKRKIKTIKMIENKA